MSINLSKLTPGNKILLETKEGVFEIEIVTPANGEVDIIGGKRFLRTTRATILGTFGKLEQGKDEGLLKPLEIEREFGINIKYHDVDGINIEFVTAPVLSARINGDTWFYEVWDNKDRDSKLEQSLNEARARLRVAEVKTDTNESPDL